MDTLTEQRLKEMEAEMSRFEEEISVPQEETPIRIIGAGTYSQVKAELASKEPTKPAQISGGISSLPILPPPPPPPILHAAPSTTRPAFMPPQLRYRPLAPPPPPPSGTLPVRPRPPPVYEARPPAPLQGPYGVPKWPSESSINREAPAVIQKPQIVYSAPPVHNKVAAKKKKKANKDKAPNNSDNNTVKVNSDSKQSSLAKNSEVATGIELNVPLEEVSAECIGGAVHPSVMTDDQQAMMMATGTAGSYEVPRKEKKAKKRKFMRTAANEQWEDPTLAEWEQDDFRIFCGDLGNEVTDETLTRAFSRYPTFLKARVVRDKKSNKTKGYGFASFKDPTDFVRAMREMNGKYVGNRPIKLRKSSWQDRQLEVVRKKDREKKRLGFR